MKVGTRNERERIEWLAHALKQIPRGLRILDAGAGEQQFRKLCSHLNYVAQDFGQYDGQGNCRGLQMGTWDQSELDIVSDITNIPEPDESFDAIMCVEVFEHLPDPVGAIKEFSRLLRPGGYLILTSPFCSLTHFAPYHFYSGFNQYFYEKHLSEHKFEIHELKKNGNFFEYLAQELRRLPFISTTYAGFRYPWLLSCVINPLLLFLSIFSKRDKGSDELLCFGYQVYAIKKELP